MRRFERDELCVSVSSELKSELEDCFSESLGLSPVQYGVSTRLMLCCPMRHAAILDIPLFKSESRCRFISVSMSDRSNEECRLRRALICDILQSSSGTAFISRNGTRTRYLHRCDIRAEYETFRFIGICRRDLGFNLGPKVFPCSESSTGRPIALNRHRLFRR